MLLKLTCLLCILKCIFAQYNEIKYPCPLQLSIDISNGFKINHTIYSDNVMFHKENYFHYNSTIRGCICKIKVCIKKCCPIGMKIGTENNCIAHNSSEINFYLQPPKKIKKDYYYLPEPLVCKPNKFPIVYSTKYNTGDNYTIYENGTVEIGFGISFDKDTYCIENEFDQPDVIVACSSIQEEPESYKYIGMMLSMPFLLATFIVYALLPDRNLHMKYLMFYVISLLLGYIFLVTIQLDPNLEKTQCTTIAYLSIFCFMLSFFWMNVICWNIWATIDGLNGLSIKKSVERSIFHHYCAYAWGGALIHILFLSAINKFDTNTAAWYHPNIGNGQCFLKGGYPQFLYLYFPMAILIGTNITLFALTAWKIRNVQKDTNNQKFNIYLKLFIAMGVNWWMEIISWAVNWNMDTVPNCVWRFTDFFNAAYGVVIFFLFVFNKNIWSLLKERYYYSTRKGFMAQNIYTTLTNDTDFAPNVSIYGNGKTTNTIKF